MTLDEAPATTTLDISTEPSTSVAIPGKMARWLQSVGRYETFQDLRRRSKFLAPFEMRQALDPIATGEAIEARITRALPFWEGLRNTLVVVPLMITWFSLALAGAAYEQSIQALPKNSTSQLASLFQMWQEGFPLLKYVAVGSLHIPLVINHTRTFTFSEVGFLDFAILAVLLLLTAFIQLVEARAIRIGRKVTNWLDQQLFEFTKASVMWSLDPTAPDKPRWAAALEEAVFRSVDSAADVQNTAAKLTEVYQQIHAIYQELDATLPTVKDQVESINKNQQLTTEEWQRMVRQLQVAIEGIAAVGETLDPYGRGRGLRQQAHAAGQHSRPRDTTTKLGGMFQRVRSWWSGR